MKFAPRGDADPETQRRGELLRHQDRVAVVNGYDPIQLVEFDDRRDELVRHALDAVMPDLVTGRERRRLGGWLALSS